MALANKPSNLTTFTVTEHRPILIQDKGQSENFLQTVRSYSTSCTGTAIQAKNLGIGTAYRLSWQSDKSDSQVAKCGYGTCKWDSDLEQYMENPENKDNQTSQVA